MNDNDRSYSVHACEHGVWVMGRYAPTDDISALLKAWHYRGLRHCSLAAAKQLGALVAVVEHSGDEVAWMEELASQSAPGG